MTRRLQKLKPGPGLTHEEVGANQRARLLAAAIALGGEVGPGAVTVRRLSAAAGISTGTFYAHFQNVDQCMAAAVAQAAGRALARSTEAVRPQEADFGEQLRGVLEWVASERRQSRLLLVDCFGDGGALTSERRRAEGRFEATIGRTVGVEAGRTNPRLRAAVAGVTHAARAELLAGAAEDAPALTDELERWARSILAAPTGAMPKPIPDVGGAPGSRPAVSPGFGDDRQRALEAAIKLAGHHGFRSLTGPQIRAQAGIVRRRFDQLFAGVEQCFLEAIEWMVLSLVGEAERTSRAADDWLAGVAGASTVICRELARRPTTARLTLVEVLAPGPAGLRCRERLITVLAERLRLRAPPPRRPSCLEATASVAAAWRILEAEVLTGREQRLPRVAPTIAQVLAAPVTAA